MNILANVYEAYEVHHLDHQVWNNQLNFYADELKIFENYLSKLVGKLSNRDLLAEVEHFQNQFIRQKEVLDQLKHDIKVNEQRLSREIQNGFRMSEEDQKVHEKLREQVLIFDRIYKELKVEFQQFLLSAK
ncbi:MAG: hypothetical protein AAFO07_23295 [Bacteroidota bacterium]